MKKHKNLLLTLFILFVGCQQNTIIGQQVHESIKIETDKVFDKLVKIRRQIHENPELAGKEKQTQETIKQYLLGLGLEVKTDIYGYGLVGILEGDKKGKKIAWRADMDALPNDFPDNVDFKSKTQGVQHGCGHDVHIAVALGIAEVLSKHKKSLKGTAYFIFQPEEETFLGAKGMVEKGLFNQIKPDEIYGLHITPFSVGQIMVKPKELFAYQRRVSIKLKETVSESTLQKLESDIKSRLARNLTDKKPWEIQHALDPQAGLTNPNGIFKDYQFVDDNYFSIYPKDGQQYIEFYVYETDEKKVSEIIPTVRQEVVKNGFESKIASISFIQDNPTVVNDEQLTNEAVKTIQSIYGNESALNLYGQFPFSNDDFVYYQQKVPGVYFFLGGSNFQKGMIAMIHAPNFMVDEESIRIGVKTFSSLIAERLK
jgi:metal-dependent amidase/aminoacylase/carboxypeptidase family protein